MVEKYKLMVFDIDGTLTDGKLYIGETGEIMKAFNAHDAVGIRKLPALGIKTIVITGRQSKITEIRCKEMNITEIYQNIDNKLLKLQEILQEQKIDFKEVIYMGDDENDYDCMKACGFSVCPNNAVKKIKDIANYICKASADEAAAREFIDEVLLSKK